MCVRCHWLGMPMHGRCTMPRHAIDDTIASSSRSSIRKLSTLGCRRGRPGCVRSLMRSNPDNTGDRFDPIRSHPGQWQWDNACHLQPQTTDALRQVPIFPGVGSPTPSGYHRDFLHHLLPAIGHAIGTNRGDTYGPPPPFCSMIVIVSSPGSQNVGLYYGVDRSHRVHENDLWISSARWTMINVPARVQVLPTSVLRHAVWHLHLLRLLYSVKFYDMKCPEGHSEDVLKTKFFS